LDLDLGRAGAGFGRIKTAIGNLIDTGAPKAELLKTDRGVLTDAEFAVMHTWQDAEDRKILRGWINSLKKWVCLTFRAQSGSGEATFELVAVRGLRDRTSSA
jgi:hypothetical protein